MVSTTGQMQSPPNGQESHPSSLANGASSSPLAASLPRKPGRPAPNSGRKRTKLPNLSRNQSSPSHSTKISTLFHDAAASISNATRPTMTGLNSTRPRIPAHGSRHARFGQSRTDVKFSMSNTNDQQRRSERGFSSRTPILREGDGWLETISKQPSKLSSTSSHSDRAGRVDCPDSSLPVADELDDACCSSDQEQGSRGVAVFQEGQTTPPLPSFTNFETPENLNCPKNRFANLPPSSPPAVPSESDSDECHSSHGVRYIMPYSHADAERAQQMSIDAWLEEVFSTDQQDGNKAEPADEPGEKMALPTLCNLSQSSTPRHTISRTSSDKENAPPVLSLSSPKQDLPEFVLGARPPSRFRPRKHPLSSVTGVTGPKRQTYSLSPGPGPLSAPPKRKKIRSDWNRQSSPQQVVTNRDFRICGEELADALAKLSPSVEQHRKGRGRRRKRERCASYWDTDIWGRDSSVCRGKRTDGEGPETHAPPGDEDMVDTNSRVEEQLNDAGNEDHHNP